MIGKEVLNYTITSYIGKGGMGSVYLAENKYIKEQKVAIKVINGGMVNDFMRKRLSEEAKNLAQLNHPNIVHFINFDIDAEGNVYLIMDYAEGINLENYIKTVSGLIVEEKICGFFEPILDAVQYAHSHNIIHRDIKPANIMISKEGKPVVLDFGIAKIINKQNESESDKIIMGTPSYMSPEQVRGEALDQRSDIYSLGVMLHQMMTGNAPYDTTTMTEHEIDEKVCNEPLPRMKTYYKYVSDKLQKIVDKATAKDKKDRYQSCAEFKKALHDAVYPPKVSRGVKAAIAAIAVLIVGAGVYYWDFNRTKVNYYKDYTEQWGVPVGIGKLDNDAVSHREQNYRIESSKNKVRRLSLVNSKGKIVGHHDSEHMDRPSDMYIYYNNDGNIDYRTVLDCNGKVLHKEDYNDKLNLIIFQYNDEYGTEMTLSKNLVKIFQDPFSTDAEKGKISRYKLTYDDNGYVTSLKYAGALNVDYGDENGIYGREYVRDEKGRVVEEKYLGYDGQPKATKKGLCIRRHKYADNDDWIETAYYDRNGLTCTDENGTPIVKIECDQYGNRIKEIYTFENGEYALRQDDASTGYMYIKDINGNTIRRTVLGLEGKADYSKSGIVHADMEYDANGFMSKISFRDLKDNVCSSSDGYATCVCRNDEKGNQKEVWYYDERGKITDVLGYAGIKLDYDTIGNLTQAMYYGTDGGVFTLKEGYAGMKREYNPMGFLTKVTFLDSLMNPTNTVDGYSVIKKEYDKRGRLTKTSYYDHTGEKLVGDGNGIAYGISVYDDNGNEVERSFFDENGNPCLSGDGYAKMLATYDDHCNITKIRYFDVDGNPAIVDKGIGVDYVRDERGNILSEMNVGEDGRLAKGKLHVKYKYDSFDNVIEFSVFDRDGKPAENTLNYHKYACKYDERNQRTEIRYYDNDGKLTTYKKDKYAIQKDEYDVRGNRVKTSYLGTDEKPVCCNDGWASTTREYDNYSNVIHQVYFGINGKTTDPNDMIPEGFVKYDKWGNMVYLATGDGAGNIIFNSVFGCAITRYEYDEKGKQLSEEYFDANDKPMLNNAEGCHRKQMTYDDGGHQTSVAYFDNLCKPMINDKLSYYMMTQKHDSKGNETEKCYFGVKGEPILVSGYHMMTCSYDKFDNLLVSACYDTKGNPINLGGGRGAHKVVYTYDEYGNNKTKKVYKADGTMSSEQIWDSKKNEWVSEDLGWQKKVREIEDSLPMTIELMDGKGNLIITSSRVTSKNSWMMIMNIDKSKYEMSADMINYYKVYMDAFTKEMKKIVSDKAYVTSVLNDSKGREIYKCKF